MKKGFSYGKPFFMVIRRYYSSYLFQLLGLFADIGQNTTVNIQHMTVDGIRSMRSQEHSGTTQFLGIQPTTGRCLGADERIERMAATVWLTLTQRSGLWSCDITWANTVTLNVILTIL